MTSGLSLAMERRVVRLKGQAFGIPRLATAALLAKKATRCRL